MPEQPLKVAVIGGGAAGFFAAISCKAHHPKAQVTIYEKTAKTLAKVKISGGGRCNVTHACFELSALLKNYPRGDKQLKKVFAVFSTPDTVRWFEERGVPLKAEADHRMFPTSNSSQSIIDCLGNACESAQVSIETQAPITSIRALGDSFALKTKNSDKAFQVDKVIVATGGAPKVSGLQWLADLGHAIVPPVPSLFTFNMPEESCQELMGVTVPNAAVKIEATQLEQKGAVLFTHWGMSGPAILKLSAWGARMLHEKAYTFKVLVNWLGGTNEQALRETWEPTVKQLLKRKIINRNPFGLPQRLWEKLLQKAGIDAIMTWESIGKKEKNRLINTLVCDTYKVTGKTTFKDEFVTCGGVSLAEVDFKTMQSRKMPGMYFAGEVLDVDGITGGFNFQAAWSTAFVAGKLL